MFIVRQAAVDDADTLLKLARMVHSNNLPADQSLILAKVAISRRSFSAKIKDPRGREYMFVVEETETGNVLGTSSIIAAMGGRDRPHLYFHVRKREHYSEDLQTGQLHTTLQLGADESGPSEIGGLILSPAYRGHKARLGSLLSFIRFHYIGAHREHFADRIIAEMMGPVTPDSRNTLWEYLGRRFINLSYSEADLFSRNSKEFIQALFPPDEIYVSLLPPEARRLIGKVGPETEPALAMLQRLGFKYHHHIDPFDGGPYIEAESDSISLVSKTRRVVLAEGAAEFPELGLVSFEGPAGFRATRTDFAEIGNDIAIPTESMEILGASIGDTIAITPRRPSGRTLDEERILEVEPSA